MLPRRKLFIAALTLAVSLMIAVAYVAGSHEAYVTGPKSGFHEWKTSVDITDEGWFLIMSPDLNLITEICANVGERPGYRALGCSWWDPPEVLPARSCLMVVYTGNPKDHKNSPQTILDHEYRHCREGYFKENH